MMNISTTLCASSLQAPPAGKIPLLAPARGAAAKAAPAKGFTDHNAKWLKPAKQQQQQQQQQQAKVEDDEDEFEDPSSGSEGDDEPLGSGEEELSGEEFSGLGSGEGGWQRCDSCCPLSCCPP